MSKTISVTSPAQFSQLTSSSKIVVVDFYADWCGPCKQIAPVYEQLSQQLTRPGKITFTRVDVDAQQQIARSFNVTAMPTFLILQHARETTRIQGANPKKLQEAVKKLAAEAESLDTSTPSSTDPSSSSSSGSWLGTTLPRGYSDITDQVDVRGLELLNFDAEAGNARTLFESSRPSGLASSNKSGKLKAAASEGKGKKDWVESDTDEQLMLFVPFMATLKIHTLLITSLPPSPSGDDADDAPMRPKTIRLFTNRPHNLGFEEASDATPTQEVVLSEKDWDAETGTARVELRFVKFQKCSSLVVFVVDGDGDGDEETVRVDRIRVVGDSGTKREMGTLEKIGDEPGE